MTLFDNYVIVDWSANSTPKAGKDSIWLANGEWSSHGSLTVKTQNPRTRAEATTELVGLLKKHVAAERSVLVGFDFPYGYAAGFAAACRSSTPNTRPWLATWNYLTKNIQDDPSNRNNRFVIASGLNQACGMAAGPFWGCPPNAATDYLSTKGPAPDQWNAAPLCRYRHTERRLRDGKMPVQEGWKLFTKGSVGSQALLGIPRVAALRLNREFKECSAVWPFETGFTPCPVRAEKPSVVHAEIWPSITPIGEPGQRVKDDVQVESLVRYFAALDQRNELGRLFDKPMGLDAVALDQCVSEEGWILGA